MIMGREIGGFLAVDRTSVGKHLAELARVPARLSFPLNPRARSGGNNGFSAAEQHEATEATGEPHEPRLRRRLQRGAATERDDRPHQTRSGEACLYLFLWERGCDARSCSLPGQRRHLLEVPRRYR